MKICSSRNKSDREIFQSIIGKPIWILASYNMAKPCYYQIIKSYRIFYTCRDLSTSWIDGIWNSEYPWDEAEVEDTVINTYDYEKANLK